ncbi:aldo-keto reductase family 1 member A1-B-like isoform X2 [Leptopilina heterotoma]|nr:aldo-keto reductase family 1 member A1-B-like isoform X2 [Leptopilina heterotoma]
MINGVEFEYYDEDLISTELRSGARFPNVGLGTWNAFAPFSDKDVELAVVEALTMGYRLIDCSPTHLNEKAIGKALRQIWTMNSWTTITRDDIFIVSKLPPTGNRPGGVAKHLNQTLKDLQLDYLDLYLIEAPWTFEEDGEKLIPTNEDGEVKLDMNTDNIATWREMEKQVDLGKVRAIGLSNFEYSQVMEIDRASRIPISVIQMEMHAYFQPDADHLDKYREMGIKVMACCPLGSPGLAKFTGKPEEFSNPMNDPTVKKIADKYDKTPARVLLRFLIQKGVSVIPKSYDKDRLYENSDDYFDWELECSDIEELDALNKGPNGRVLDFVSFFKGIEKHPQFQFQINKKTEEEIEDENEDEIEYYIEEDGYFE